jgi:uncharacterized membrane protein YphA (DoxX/SURF4 family)
LLLRTALGGFVLYHSGMHLLAGSSIAIEAWIVELLLGLCALLLIVGLFTPCAAAVISVLQIIAHSFVSPSIGRLFFSSSSTAFAAALAVSIVMMGPGALSLDARLFGLREIIIPPSRVKGSPDQR